MDELWNAPDAISWTQALVRLAAALVLPFLIGAERYLNRKPIDFRPFVIISLSAAALAMGAMELVVSRPDAQFSIDPARIFEGVITGIGFIGAGAMFRQGNYVQGAGSAASIWAAGAIGLLCGIGEIWLAAIITAAILALLIASSPFTKQWDPHAGGDGDADDDRDIGD